MDERRPEFDEGRRAYCGDRISDNPYDCDTEEYRAWEDGWCWAVEYTAIQWWVSEYFGFYRRYPTVGEAAATFFIGADRIAELFGDQPMPGTFRTHTDRALPAQLLESEGE